MKKILSAIALAGVFLFLAVQHLYRQKPMK